MLSLKFCIGLMAGDNYRIKNQSNRFYLTLTVDRWIDVFSRQVFRDVLIDSLRYCRKERGVGFYAWLVLTNHIHLIAACNRPYLMLDFLRDFKKFTSKEIFRLIQEVPASREEWLLNAFSFEARRNGRAKEYKLWKDDNYAIDLDGMNIGILEKSDYIHQNPVRAGFVREAEVYVYSSAVDYAGCKGLLEVIVV